MRKFGGAAMIDPLRDLLDAIVSWFTGAARLAGDDRFVGRVRKEQVAAIFRLTPFLMGANFVNGVVVVYAFWPSGPRLFLACWFLALSLTVYQAVGAWHARRHQTPPQEVSKEALRRVVWRAFWLAVIWASLPLVLFIPADPAERLLLAVLMVGTVSGGVFAFSTVLPAMAVFVAIILLASAAALTLAGEALHIAILVLLVSYAGVIGRSAIWNARLFVGRLQNQFDLEEQSELIGILLRDFEESASDWLWEIDADGRLQHVSGRLAAVLGRRQQELQGQHLVDFLVPHEAPLRAQAGHALHDLLGCFVRRVPFRDLVINVAIGSDRRWWSLTAKPVHDMHGKFQGYRGVGTDVTDQTRAERQLAQLARSDPLTDLANRGALNEHLESAFERAHGAAFALICLDLDGFKAVNDSLGHAAGDRLLQIVARRLQRCARQDDMVARIGGDEFALVQPAEDQPAAGLALARRIVEAISAPYELGGEHLSLGASVGIAVAFRDGDSPSSLLQSADLALYRAKREGRGTYCQFQPGLAMRGVPLQPVEDDLRSALAKGELALHYQPIIQVESGEISGLEAMIFWQDRPVERLAPALGHPLIIDTALVDDLTRWMIDQAITALPALPGQLRIALNLSSCQFGGPAMSRILGEALAASGCDPARLEIEVAENALEDERSDGLAYCTAFKQQGVTLALDRFGAGSSALGHLRRLPFDRVKLDRSLIDEGATGGAGIAVVQAVAGFAAGLGIGVTADGVETDAQLSRLRHAGCTEAQGPLFCRPRPLASLAGFLESRAERQVEVGFQNKVKARADIALA
jgi:diguanylate cyclase (GGDEF)-like protein/PAS domain S-box-containing protein